MEQGKAGHIVIWPGEEVAETLRKRLPKLTDAEVKVIYAAAFPEVATVSVRTKQEQEAYRLGFLQAMRELHPRKYHEYKQAVQVLRLGGKRRG